MSTILHNSASELLQFNWSQRLPMIHQTENIECGLACLAMIGRFHGHDMDLNGLRQRFSLSVAGASLRSLMNFADQLGFSTRPLRVELEALHKVQTPAILHWDLNHFVVLVEVRRRAVVDGSGAPSEPVPSARLSTAVEHRAFDTGRTGRRTEPKPLRPVHVRRSGK